jgi:hypothetical protein
MNKINMNLKLTAFILLVATAFTSCLKDKGAENGTYGMSAFTGGEFVSIPLAASNANPLALESKSGAQSLSLFQAAYEFETAASEDIKVTLVKDDPAVTATDATLTLLPASVVSYPASLEVVIPKGQRISGNFKMDINTGTLDPLKSYGIAFTVSAISKSGASIPKNLKTVVYKIALKNKYDGVYKVTGPMTDIANGALTNWMPYWTANLETTGPASVAVRDMTYTGGIYHPIMSGGAASYYGTFGMLVDFDPATNKATNMVSPWEPAANTRTARLDPTGTNSWNPTTRTITIRYFMYQPSVTGATPRVTFDETWTYVKAR